MNRIVVAGSVALAFAGALSLGLTEAEAKSGKSVRFQNEKNLIVTLVTPTLNQEVLPDLSDPGLNGVVTIHFSSPIRRRDVINRQNSFNRLTSKVEFFDSSFARLPGEPKIRRNRLIFDPRTQSNGGVLPQGQYTMNVKRSLRNRRGRLLNFGTADFSSVFSVGIDIYPPVLRKIAPIEGQTNIGLTQKVIGTFNEPIDPSSIIAGVRVEDASTNPPTAIPGAGGGTGVALARNGFDIVFTPDPCFGYPPLTTIQFLMQGVDSTGTASPVTDVFGNGFVRDQGLQWVRNLAAGPNVYDSPLGTFDEDSGVFRTQFRTKGVRTPPVGVRVGSPNIPPPPLYPFLYWTNQGFSIGTGNSFGRVLLYTTNTGIGELDLSTFIAAASVQNFIDYTLINPIANAPVRVGRPTAVLTDPRWDPLNGHTFIYALDARSSSVAVIDSRNLKVLGRMRGFSSARDIGLGSDPGPSGVTMYVTDFASNQVVVLDMETVRVNFAGQPGAASVCDAIKDQVNRRTFVQVGRGPTNVAVDHLRPYRVGCLNTLDSSLTTIQSTDNSVTGTFETGSNPAWISFTMFGYGQIDMAMIASQGGLLDPDGSIGLFVRSGSLGGGFFGAAQTRNGIEATITDNVKNPTHVWSPLQHIRVANGNSVTQNWYVANTGGRTALELTWNAAGLFGLQLSPGTVRNIDVGPNPTTVMLDPYYPEQFEFAAVAGTGNLAAFDPLSAAPPTLIKVPGIRLLGSCYSH